ncbi:MAG: hypothetical protein S0880_12935 [Actinomycetota bacterium]|nr:hypothetical protein [Actinomycetota bacterium]
MSGSPGPDDLARALVGIGRRVRDRVRSGRSRLDAAVARTEGGDDIFAIDVRADEVLLAALDELAAWPGELVMEGFGEPLAVGGGGPWRYLVDPLDGTRPLLADKRSAWVLLGAGRRAETLEDLEVAVAIEVPTSRADLARVVAVVDGRFVVCEDDDLRGGDARAAHLRPLDVDDPTHTFVTVVRFAPGHHERIGAWQDAHLDGLVTFDDLVPCTAGQMMGLATGADAAVFDPRPLLAPGSMAAHPYDAVAMHIARAAGAIVEALPSGPMDYPLDLTTPVAWAGYANAALAERLRPHGPIAPAPSD